MRKVALTIIALLAFIPLPAPAADFLKGYAAYQAGDWETALKELRPLAEQGHASAQFNLALLYNYGKGVPQTYREAVTR